MLLSDQSEVDILLIDIVGWIVAVFCLKSCTDRGKRNSFGIGSVADRESFLIWIYTDKLCSRSGRAGSENLEEALISGECERIIGIPLIIIDGKGGIFSVL